MYLSYSGFKIATTCLFQYWLVYIYKKAYSYPDDRLGSIYGIVVGKLFEDFYNEKMWRSPGVKQRMEARVEAEVDRALAEALEPSKGRPGGVIKWRGEGEDQNPTGLYADKEELMRDIVHGISLGLDAIKRNILIGKDAVSEIKLDATVEGHRIGGRADFVMTRAKTRDRIIVDGKGSKRREKYVDPQQLLWYAMLHRIRFGEMPDKTAFLYWKFEHPVALDWHEFSNSDADKLLKTILRVVTKIESLARDLDTGEQKPLSEVRKVFKPKATISNCMFCPYAAEDVCPEGFVKRSEYERKKADRLAEG